MSQPARFAEVVEAADHLSEEEQQELVDVLRRRMSERARERLLAEARESDEEFKAGRCKPVTVEELMREIRS